MQEYLVQFIASHRKNYPRGIPISAADEFRLRVVFFSDQPLSAEARTLIHNAAQKGLKLGDKQYAVLSQGDPVPAAGALVLLGKTGTVPADGSVRVVQTHCAEAILADASKKREFWENIKGLTGV